MAMGRQTTPAQFAVHDNDTTIKYTAYTVGLCQNRKLRESTTSGRTTAAYPWPPLNSNCIQVMHCLVLGHVQCVICKLTIRRAPTMHVMLRHLDYYQYLMPSRIIQYSY